MKHSYWLFSLFTAALFVGCSSDLEDPDKIPEDQKMQLFTTKNALAANGTDTTLVVCRVPADVGRLEITFFTSKGVFLFTGTNTIKQATDSVSGNYRFATTVLKADTVRNTVYITAETGINRKRTSITFN